MAPKASVVDLSVAVQSSAPSTPASANPKPWVPIPVALSIFLGLCLAYTLSYVLYRIIMSRRRPSEDDIPDSPDRGVSQFMNGARLTLNLGLKSTPVVLDKSPNMPDEKRPLTDPSHPAHSEVAMSSPAPSSTPVIILTPSFVNEGSGEAQVQQQHQTEPETPILAPSPAQQPFSQRVAAKVKFLSRDRAEAIALDPKLAPVQGPLRPLSMVPSPSRKKRTTLFGLGLRHLHRDPETEPGVQ